MMTVKMSEKDSKEEIIKAFKLFDDDDTVSKRLYLCVYHCIGVFVCTGENLL